MLGAGSIKVAFSIGQDSKVLVMNKVITPGREQILKVERVCAGNNVLKG